MTFAALHDYGPFLGGLAAILSIGFGILKWMIDRAEKRITKQQAENLDSWYFEQLKQMLQAAADKAGAAKTRVIDIHFVHPEITLRIPLIRDLWLTVLPGCDIMGDTFAADKTTYFLRCDNTALIRPHRHSGSEVVTVIHGIMTDLQTGTVYRPGETWRIPAGEVHSVHFEAPRDSPAHGIFLIEVTPPLPDTAHTSLDLDGMASLAR